MTSLTIRKVERPKPFTKARALAFLRFETNDLNRSMKFFEDFGLKAQKRTSDLVTMSTTQSDQIVLILNRGRCSKFLGSAFIVPDDAPFEELIKTHNGRPLNQGEAEGVLGPGMALKDPTGHEVWLLKQPYDVPSRSSSKAISNLNEHGFANRVNQTIRPDLTASDVLRLGHVVLQAVEFDKSVEWYMTILGLIPSDVQYLDDGSPTLAFMRLDLGDQPADHHTVVIAGGITDQYEHSAFEVRDLDSLGMGQRFLKQKGHEHFWGIGRHILGSQIFDYWKSPDGFEFEHYCDGDLFTSSDPTNYVPFNLASLWNWGPDLPHEMTKPVSLTLIFFVLKHLMQGRISLKRIKLLARAMAKPSR